MEREENLQFESTGKINKTQRVHRLSQIYKMINPELSSKPSPQELSNNLEQAIYNNRDTLHKNL